MAHCEKCGRDSSCLHTSNISNIEIYILLAVTVIMSQGSFFLSKYIYGELNNYQIITTGAIALSIYLIILLIIYYGFNKQYIALFFGCHQKIDRSFINKDKKPFILCARCTGILIGILISSLLYSIISNVYLWLLLMIPLLIDGMIQKRTDYRSNNIKRLLTGILFGPGFVIVFSYLSYYLHQLNTLLFEFILNI
jgi:uncharacterized membrane protein